MKFIITGSGRTGTMFVSQALARSRSHTVIHEHADDGQGWFHRFGTYDRKGHLKFARMRFENKTNYGEVNSLLRFIVTDIEVDKRAVLIRHPLEVALSSINKFPIRWFGMFGFSERVDSLESDLQCVDSLIKSGLPFFRFEEYTKNADGMAPLLDWVGLDDVHPTEIDYSVKVNAAGRGCVKNVHLLLPDHRRLLSKKLKWFADKYYGGEWA